MYIRLLLQGADAHEVSQTLAGVLAMAGVQATVTEADSAPEGQTREAAAIAGAAFAAATFVLSIPSAVLAVLELADRVEKRQKAVMLLESLKSFCQGKDVTVTFRSETEDKVLLEMDADTLLEWADKLQQK